MSLKYICLLLFFSVILSGCSSTDHANKKVWTQVESADGSKPIKRHEAAFVNVGGKFYLLGGRGIKPVSIYDVNAKKWSEGMEPPMEIHHFQPVVYKSKIYIIGALTGKYPEEQPVDHIIIYDPKNDRWEKGSEIPENRRRGSTGNIVKDGKIYVSCGISRGHISGHRKWLDSYDLETGTWKVLPDAPRARDHFQAVEENNKIYLLAGRLSKAPKATFSETIGEVDCFDMIEEKWTTLEHNIPTQRAGNMALLYGEQILVIGGESASQETAHNEVEGLDTKKHKWKSYPPLMQGRHGTGAFMYKNQIFIASGCGNRGGSPELESMEKY